MITYKSRIAIIISYLFTTIAVKAQYPFPSNLWTQYYSFPNEAQCWGITHSSDGGYAIGGIFFQNGYLDWDALLLKINAAGNSQWSHTYGGGGTDYCYSVVSTTDGGYALGGWTGSFGGGMQLYLVKTDSSGNLLWQHTYGFTYNNMGYCVRQTSDGGFILGGTCAPGWEDMYLVKTDSLGNMQWQHNYGGPFVDWCYTVEQTHDGGYILGGLYGSDNDTLCQAWLVKTDSYGNEEWNSKFGNLNYQSNFYAIRQSVDGSYICGGSSGPHSGSSMPTYLVKIDSLGRMQWQHSYNFPSVDATCRTIFITPDKGYLLSCVFSQVVKTDSIGNMLWSHVYYQGFYGTYFPNSCQGEAGTYTLAGYRMYEYPPNIMTIHVAGLQEAWVHLLPLNPPIAIPASGGSFQYTISLTNCGTVASSPDAWIMVKLPGGQNYGPVLGPIPVRLDTAQTVSRLRTQNVPASAPAGVYTYKAYIGTYNTVKWDSSNFMFTKLGSGIQDTGFSAWACVGELFPGELSQTALIPSDLDLDVSPNPFNPTTAISYQLSALSHVSLKVYDTAGRLVETLVDEMQEAGSHRVIFDGSKLPSGVYLYRLQVPGSGATPTMATGKMVLPK